MLRVKCGILWRDFALRCLPSAADSRLRSRGLAMSQMLRFPDLVARGLFVSRMTLKRAIDSQGFPPGVLITPNARAWSEAEVNAWIAARPVSRKSARKAA